MCGATTQPWYGKALLLSSAGELTDSDQDWFHEFISHYSTSPHPNVHVFVSSETLNPKVSQKLVDMTSDVFGALESTRPFAGIEAGNEFLRRGQGYMTPQDVRRAVDASLRNADSMTSACVGFLDTSITVEKTSLVVLAEEPGGASPWERVAQVRLDYWLPAQLPGGVIDEKLVRAHLEAVLSTFTGLRVLHIDTRGMPWAIALQRDLARRWPVLKAWDKNSSAERDAGWKALSQRMLSRPPTIRIQDDAEQMREFAGLRLKFGQNDAAPKVVDRDRRKSHADITEGLALCCYLVALEQIKATRPGFAEIYGRAKVRVADDGETVGQRVARLKGMSGGTIMGGLGRGPESY